MRPPFPGGQNSLFLSTGTGGLIAQRQQPALPQGLRLNHGTSLGDINHDGYLDIFVNALNNNHGHANDLLVNDGTGHFIASPSLLPAAMSSTPVRTPGVTWSMLKDLNNDGYGDIVLGTWDNNPNPSQVILNDGHGSFAVGHAAQPAAQRRRARDRHRHRDHRPERRHAARPDAVGHQRRTIRHAFYQVPYLQLLVNLGNGQFRDETDLRLPQSKIAAAGRCARSGTCPPRAVDFNDDGAPDILVDSAGAVIQGPDQRRQGPFHARDGKSVAGAHVLADDIDGDGMPDLIESSSNGLSVLHNTLRARTTCSPTFIAPAPTAARSPARPLRTPFTAAGATTRSMAAPAWTAWSSPASGPITR